MPNLNLPKVGDKNTTGWAQKMLNAFGLINADLDGRLAPEKVKLKREDYVTTSEFGALGNGDDSDALTRMFDFAVTNGKQVRIDSTVRGSVSLTDVPVNIDGSAGRWMQDPGVTPLRIRHSLIGGAYGQTVSSVGSIIIEGSGESETDEDAKWQAYNTLTVPNSVYTALTPNQGDWLKVTSDDTYAGEYLGSDPDPTKKRPTWASEPCQVVGVLVRMAATGTISADAMVQGAVSGATGYVASNRKEYGETTSANRVLMLNNVTGVFQDGETLIQSGAERGTVRNKALAVNLMMVPELLKTNVRVHKYRDLPVVVNNLTFIASSDVDSDQPSTSRAPAIEMRTVAGASIDFQVASSWRQGMRMISCVGFRVRAKIDKLPGYAEDDRAAWGYGIEAFGATAYGDVDLVVHNVRHGFSTNIRITAVAPSTVAAESADFAYATAGVAAKISVTGTFYNCTDAALDTHGGSMYIRFHDFYVSGSMSGGRTQARPTGVQNRSFATTVENGVIEDVVDGIRDISTYFPSPYPVARATTHIRNITMRGILHYGVAATQTATTDESKGFARVVLTNLDIAFRFMPNLTGNLAPNKQCGVRAKGGRIELNNVIVRGSNDCYARFDGGSTGVKEVLIRGGLMDIADAPNQSYGIRLTGDIAKLAVDGLKVRAGDWAVPSIIRSSTALSATTLRTDNCGALDVSDNMAAISGGGSLASVVALRSGNTTLRGSTQWAVPTLANGANSSTTFTVTGASLGDYVTAAPEAATSGVTLAAYVSGTNNVTVVATNNTGSSKSLGTLGVRVKIEK